MNSNKSLSDSVINRLTPKSIAIGVAVGLGAIALGATSLSGASSEQSQIAAFYDAQLAPHLDHDEMIDAIKGAPITLDDAYIINIENPESYLDVYDEVARRYMLGADIQAFAAENSQLSLTEFWSAFDNAFSDRMSGILENAPDDHVSIDSDVGWLLQQSARNDIFELGRLMRLVGADKAQALGDALKNQPRMDAMLDEALEFVFERQLRTSASQADRDDAARDYQAAFSDNPPRSMIVDNADDYAGIGVYAHGADKVTLNVAREGVDLAQFESKGSSLTAWAPRSETMFNATNYTLTITAHCDGNAYENVETRVNFSHDANVRRNGELFKVDACSR